MVSKTEEWARHPCRKWIYFAFQCEGREGCSTKKGYGEMADDGSYVAAALAGADGFPCD